MDITDLQEHWALIVAAILIAIVALVIAFQIYRMSAYGQLRSNVTMLAKRRRALRRAGVAVRRAQLRLEKINQRADQVRPRIVQEVRDSLADAEALQKIAHDQVLIAENYLRRVIHEEFPPRKHGDLRARFLPPDHAESNPFTL